MYLIRREIKLQLSHQLKLRPIYNALLAITACPNNDVTQPDQENLKELEIKTESD